MSNLVKFEEFNVEFLTKEDVVLSFNGSVLFNGNQTADILGYVNSTKAIFDHVEDEFKYKVKNSDILNRDFRKLNNAGETFIDEDGVIDLTYKSKLPKASDFRKQVREVIKQVQSTGRYDTVENQLMEITDEKEKQLEMKVYKLQQVYDIDPEDGLSRILLKEAKTELHLYKKQKEINEVKNQVVGLYEKLDKVSETGELIQKQQMYICNRTNFDDKMRILANKYFGRDMTAAYSALFKKMRLLGSFDVQARKKAEWDRLNKQRMENGKTPYKEGTLKKKYNTLNVIDDNDKWELASEAYKTIETEKYNT